MGTKIQGNVSFPYFHSVVLDLDGNTSNAATSSLYSRDIQLVKTSQQDPNSVTSWMHSNGCSGYDIEQVRQTIMKHESIFKSQLQELHRLYRKQRDLMTEIKRTNMKEDYANTQRFSIFPGVESNSRNMNHLASYDGVSKSSLGICDTLTLARGDVSTNSSSNSHLEPNNFLQNYPDAMKGGTTFGNSVYRKERTGNEHLTDRHTEKKGSDLSRKKRKIFGVEISEENNDLCDAASHTVGGIHENGSINFEPFWKKGSTTLQPKPTPGEVSIEPSSWNGNTCVQNIEFGGTFLNNGANERSMGDLNNGILCKNSLFPHSEMERGSSSISFNIVNDSAPCETSDPKNSKGKLPWFLTNTQYNGDPSKETKSSYFMNLNSLKKCSETFFRKGENGDGSFQSSRQRKETSALVAPNEINNSDSTKMILGFRIPSKPQIEDLNYGDDALKVNCALTINDSAREVEKDENARNQLEKKDLVIPKGASNYISDLRHHIDLNLSLDEEDAPLTSSLPTAFVKIATNEINLEAPGVTECNANASPKKENPRNTEVSSNKLEMHGEECDKIAADALIFMSACSQKNLVENGAWELPEADTDNLKWFADVISSQCGDTASIQANVAQYQNGTSDENEEAVPDGMDYFEFMTLKLKDTKEENYLYNPPLYSAPSNEDTIQTVMFPKRARRGRPRKDFQRNILPSLVTLSRQEVTEDLQAFEEMCKSEGSSTRNFVKKGRGRKRAGGLNVSTPAKPHSENQTQQHINQELGLVEASLAGWGRKTRRLPRQRCPNAYLSFAVKC